MTLSFIFRPYSFSCQHRCDILYGFCVEYSVLLSLGLINISCSCSYQKDEDCNNCIMQYAEKFPPRSAKMRNNKELEDHAN